MTKTTLLTAASAAAVLIAGGAQAGTISGTINSVSATAAAPYTIASERTNASDATASGGVVVTNLLSSGTTVTAGSTQNYRVTFTITGGTIPTANTATLTVNGTANGGSATVADAGRTTTSVSYIVTVTGAAASAGYALTGFTLTTQASNSSAESSIGFGSTTDLLAGGVANSIDTTANTVLVVYAPVIGAFSSTSNNALAALPNFLFFRPGAAPAAPVTGTADPAVAGSGSTAELATGFGIATNTGTFYGGLTGGAVTATSILNGGTLTISGGSQLNVLVPALVQTGGVVTTTTAPGSATFVLDNAAGDSLLTSLPDFTLSQATTPVAIQAASFGASFAPVYASGFSAPASAFTSSAGTISLDGTNFIAPWVSGSQSPSQTVIRLSNNASVASGPITLRLTAQLARAPGVNTGPGSAVADETCSSINGAPIRVGANTDLQIGATELAQCFGDFLRGDVQITVQSSAAQLTAKMRNVRPDGTFETSLGRFGSPVSY